MAAKRAFIFCSVLAIVAINVVSCSSDLNSILDNVLEDNFQTYGILNTNRGRREAEKSGIYMKKQKADLPVCHNMKGILGGWLISLTNIYFYELRCRLFCYLAAH